MTFLWTFADDFLDVIERAVKVGIKKVISYNEMALKFLAAF